MIVRGTHLILYTLPTSRLPHLHQLHPSAESADLPTYSPCFLQFRCSRSYLLRYLVLQQTSIR